MTRLPKVEILVRDPGNCRVLEAGARMIYDHPELRAQRTCAQALSVLAPAAEDLARAKAEGSHDEPLQLTCPVVGCGAVFALRALSLSEMARLRDGVAASPAEPREGRRPAPARRRTTAPAIRKRRSRSLKWIIVGLVLMVLCAGALGGPVLLAPEVLPPRLRDRLRAWGIPFRPTGGVHVLPGRSVGRGAVPLRDQDSRDP